jgi:hypothetical protein
MISAIRPTGMRRRRSAASCSSLNQAGGEARQQLLGGNGRQRRGVVVGHALAAQLGEDREIHHAGRVGEAAADLLPGVGDGVDRAREMRIAAHPVVLGGGEFDVRRLLLVPEEAASRHVGMEGAREHGDPGHRHAVREQLLAQPH